MDKLKISTAGLWEWVKAICVLALVGVVSYKVYITPMNLTVDFPTLLSLLLALFSVALAALFYFKATETSNTFYDNTYNFTKDIAQLLVKIESGFGERLRNLDEGYSSMRDYLQKMPGESGVDKAKQRIEEEQEEINKVSEERNKLVMQLVEKAQLHGEEKEKFIRQLKEKENELEEAQKEAARLNKRLFMERIKKRNATKNSLSDEDGFVHFTKNKVVEKIGVEKILGTSSANIRRQFSRLVGGLPRGYIRDLESRGFIDDSATLNSEGVRFLQSLAEEAIE